MRGSTPAQVGVVQVHLLAPGVEEEVQESTGPVQVLRYWVYR